MKNQQLPAKQIAPWNEIIELLNRMEKTKTLDAKDVDRFRKLVVSTPKIWPIVADSAESIRRHLIGKISNGESCACMLAEVDILKQQLNYAAAPAIEQLSIDHVLTAWLRVIDAENRYNNCVVNQDTTFKNAEYWNRVLSESHARYIRAIECLARVRRLARNTPALQINIANDGGKQVNVQGDPTESRANHREMQPR